jgi:hypothetical protein
MKTKKVEFWCDLFPGWQDVKPLYVFMNTTPPPLKCSDTKRIKVTVELPCFGGSAEQDGSVIAKSEIMQEGLVIK